MRHQRPQQCAGLPDGGLFTPDQLQAVGDAPLDQGPTPARGVIEVKGTNEKRDVIPKTEQVERYWNRYKQILVTNVRDFAAVGSDDAGDRAVLERYSLAPNEASFWADEPGSLVATHAELARRRGRDPPMAKQSSGCRPIPPASRAISDARDRCDRCDRCDRWGRSGSSAVRPPLRLPPILSDIFAAPARTSRRPPQRAHWPGRAGPTTERTTPA